MNKKRSLGVSLNGLTKVKRKALIAAAVALAIGVVTVAIGAGVYWAIGIAAISAVLLIQLATSWQQARTQTERFQQLRNRVERLSREVASVSSSGATRGRAAPGGEIARSIRPSTPASGPSSQQMFDIQRELDYLLWRVSSARADNEHEKSDSDPVETHLRNDAGA